MRKTSARGDGLSNEFGRKGKVVYKVLALKKIKSDFDKRFFPAVLFIKNQSKEKSERNFVHFI